MTQVRSGKPVKVVILGSGFAGVHCLVNLIKLLKKRKDAELTLISDQNFFLFTPLLHEVATGALGTRHIAYPVRRFPSRDRFTFVNGKVTQIDLTSRQVATDAGSFDYDKLVIALGSETDLSDLPIGAKNVFKLKRLHEGMLLRNHIIECFEHADARMGKVDQKRFLTFVISGGGYVGVQLVTEMYDFIHRSLIRYYPRLRRDMVRMIVVQPQNVVLPGMPAALSEFALKLVRNKGIEVWLNSKVTAADGESVWLNGVEKIPTNTLVWVAGIVANPVVASLPVEKDMIGRVVVDECLEVKGHPGVYAFGDNAHFRDPVTGEVALARAHNAVRQARVAAANLSAGLAGKPGRQYRNPFSGGLVSLGARNAVVNAYGLRFHGFLARALWLVAYSSLVTGAYNRVRVGLDWILSLLFGRDTTLLDIR